jgi:hypothetical protein
MPLANQMLFIEMAMLLWAFEFQPPIDADGKPILPERYSVVEHGLAMYVSRPSRCRPVMSNASARQLAEAIRDQLPTSLCGSCRGDRTRHREARCAGGIAG